MSDIITPSAQSPDPEKRPSLKESSDVETTSDLEAASEDATLIDMTEVESDDPALTKKIHLINNAIDEIGFTWYHAQLFCIAGFGYSADSQMAMIQSSVQKYVDLQMKGGGYPVATQVAYGAMISGVIIFGFGADLIGRKLCFNVSLLMTAIFGFFTGGTSSYAMYTIFYFLSVVGAMGNLGTDVTVFLEYLPSKYQYLNTSMALWWGIGQTLVSLISWGFMPNYSCKDLTNCTSSQNRGWRYSWYLNSGIVLVGALLRLFVLKLKETPKFLVSHGRDEEAYNVIIGYANKYHRKCSLTLEDLQKCGEIRDDYYNTQKDGHSVKRLWETTWINIKLLFKSKRVARSTILLMLSWTLIGISYSTFYNFLYIYIAEHGSSKALSSTYVTYRNGTIANFVGIFGPVLAGFLIQIPRVGRKGTMIIGALISMAVLFAYTTCRTPAADAGFGAATYFFINIYYSCLYAYSPEVFPTRSRTTGVGLCMICVRVAGAMSPIIYWFGSESGSSVPIWVCGALIGCLSIVTAFMPFEPSKQRAV
ncbi:DEKNAAC105620 [Brettanomyces naardenensis]|uniref:DEKNAAC105620 n=1 Tax=Brettanomyces naardenensis TaxID=13370 RepID=A0A448YTP9_BRENA|nr:DEKNAAC105620 [Brettanomyces naardenensis]